MNSYVRHYYHFVKERLQCDHSQSQNAILEQLWQYYSIGQTIDTAQIRAHFQSVDAILASLSRKRQQALLRRIVDLCLEHEHVAFIEGLQIGAQLAAEIANRKTE